MAKRRKKGGKRKRNDNSQNKKNKDPYRHYKASRDWNAVAAHFRHAWVEEDSREKKERERVDKEIKKYLDYQENEKTFKILKPHRKQ